MCVAETGTALVRVGKRKDHHRKLKCKQIYYSWGYRKEMGEQELRIKGRDEGRKRKEEGEEVTRGTNEGRKEGKSIGKKGGRVSSLRK